MSVVICYVDGGCRLNGQKDEDGNVILGEGACAVLIFRNNQLIGEYARGLGPTTNNAAEYEAVLHALLICWASGLNDPLIYSDSLLAVNHITRVWRCRVPELIPLLLSIWEIQKEFRFRLVHLPRTDEGIKKADSLVNLMLDKIKEEKAKLSLKQSYKKRTRRANNGKASETAKEPLPDSEGTSE
jgi:ribonuclease HI